MRASIIALTALALLWTTSSALAQEAPELVARANANPRAAQRSHRLYFGSAMGGGSYGADATLVLGIDASYAYRMASGRDLGVTAMLATSNMFAGAFADVVAAPMTKRVSWRLGAEGGLHRIAPRYSSFDLFPEHYEIVSAPNGVFLPYAGARMTIDKTGASGTTWGFELQALYDLVLARHEVHSDGWWGTADDTMQNVGGRTIMLGFYVGHAN
jgi:hypothetical protein